MASRSHNYDYPVDINSETAAAKVVRFVGQCKRVLEIGCGPGSITKILQVQNRCTVTGLELDPDAILLATPYCDRVIQSDLNTADWQGLADELGKFETIVAADVLEHLYDPWNVLSSLKTLLREDGTIVISLPHAGHAVIAACLVNGDFEYKEWGLLDRTHIRFFGLINIDQLFSQAGLKIIDCSFVITPPEETEFANVWTTLKSNVQSALRSSVHSDIYQVVVKAIHFDAPGQAISIIDMIKSTKEPLKRDASLLTWLLSLLSDRKKASLRNLIGIQSSN